ncbi:MAG: hypothetical protein SFY69_12630 [Planctomycetota bacterium]|nr:hypothetical protein [Planctomycetota bacterium]
MYDPSPILVTKCVCHDVLFAELLERILQGAGLAELQLETGCGTSCRLCLPYVARLVETREAAQPLMNESDTRRWTARARALAPGTAGQTPSDRPSLA